MKKLTFLFSIAILFSITCVIAVSHHEKKNRYDDRMQLVISITYDPYYLVSSLIFESVDRTGTDAEGPLYSTASTWSGLCDGGYSWYTTSIYTDYNNPPSCWPENRRWTDNSLAWETKDYDERFAVSSYAYVSCNTDYNRYKTTYDLYAEVHSDFTWPNIRHVHPPHPRKGYFSDSVYRWGDTAPEGGWKYKLEQSTLVATASADGKHPSSGETHSTSAEAPENANIIDVVCDHCDDAGCSKCNPHRVDQDLTPNCDDCTDGSYYCPNASAH